MSDTTTNVADAGRLPTEGPGLRALGFAAAVGALTAALAEWWQTFVALGRLPFPATVESAKMFDAWTTAMTVAPLAAIASALLIAVVSPRRHTAMVAAALVATILLAARVWENVAGYLAPADSNADIEGTPLSHDRWPWIYQQATFVFVAVTVIAIAIAFFALWRARPRMASLAVGAIAAIALIVGGGHVGFAAISFLRLRNWSFAVALLDAIVVIRFRKPRPDDWLAWALLAIVILCAWSNATTWRTMRMSFPHDIVIPAW